MATNSTIVLVGVTISSLLGPWGTALGTGIATPIGIAAETGIKKKIAQDLRIQFEDATVGRYIYETLRNMLAAGAAAKFAQWIEKLRPEITGLVVSLARYGAKEVGSDAVEASVQQYVAAHIVSQNVAYLYSTLQDSRCAYS